MRHHPGDGVVVRPEHLVQPRLRRAVVEVPVAGNEDTVADLGDGSGIADGVNGNQVGSLAGPLALARDGEPADVVVVNTDGTECVGVRSDT